MSQGQTVHEQKASAKRKREVPPPKEKKDVEMKTEKKPDEEPRKPKNKDKDAKDEKALVISVSAPAAEEKKEIKSLAVIAKEMLDADKKRDWVVAYERTNPNRALSRAYEWRFLLNLNPRQDLFFITSDEVAASRTGDKRAKTNVTFVNMQFTREPTGFSVELVTPICDSWIVELGWGNLSLDPNNLGRKFLVDKLNLVNRKIILTDRPFEGCRLTKDGANADFHDAAERDNEIVRMLAEFLVFTKNGSLFKEMTKDGKPMYLKAVLNELYEKEMTRLKNGYEGGKAAVDDSVMAKEITQAQAKTKIANLQAKYWIDPVTEMVDDQAVQNAVLRDRKKILDGMIHSHWHTDGIKRSSNGFFIMEFKNKLVRTLSDKELKKIEDQEKRDGKAVVIEQPNELLQHFCDGSGRRYTYNGYTVDPLNNWNPSPEQLRVLTDEEKALKALKDFEIAIDPCTKMAIKYKISVFTESPQNTWGIRREFNGLHIYRGPTDEEVSRIKNGASGYTPPEDKKEEVYGAEPMKPAQIAKPLFKLPADLIKKNITRMREDGRTAAADRKAKITGDSVGAGSNSGVGQD